MENLAFQVIMMEEGELMLLGVACMIVGFVIALRLRRHSTLSLRRVPHFLYLAFVTGLISAAPLAWTLTSVAVNAGMLWALVGFVFSMIALAGFATGVLAHARSVNAYGDGSGAWMGIVPFANLFLMLKRPLDWRSSGWKDRSLNAIGTIAGFVMLILGTGVGKVAEEMTNQMADDAANQSAMLAGMAKAQGVEATLQMIASQVPRQQIDETTTLVRVEADGRILRYVYEVAGQLDALPLNLRVNLAQENCTNEVIRPIISAGASLQHRYIRTDQSEIGVVEVTPQICGF